MIRSLISEIKEFKKPSILASLFMVFEVMFEISIPFVMASLLDQGVQQRNMNNILFYGGLMLVCAFLSLFCGMQSARYGAYASAGFAKNLRRAIFKKVQTFSFENIDQFSSGGLVTRMMTDVTNVQNAYAQPASCSCLAQNSVYAFFLCDVQAAFGAFHRIEKQPALAECQTD